MRPFSLAVPGYGDLHPQRGPEWSGVTLMMSPLHIYNTIRERGATTPLPHPTSSRYVEKIYNKNIPKKLPPLFFLASRQIFNSKPPFSAVRFPRDDLNKGE